MPFLTRLLLCFIMITTGVQADKEKKPVEPLPEISMGKADAPVVIVEYSSLTCNHCAEFHATVLPEIIKKYVDPGYVRLIIRDFPGDRIALVAHQTAWCQGKAKYLDFVKLFYATQDEWLLAKDPVKALKAIALKNGMTPQQFEACTKSTALMDTIIQGRLKAQKKYKIKATPTLVINATAAEPQVIQEALSLKEMEDALRPLVKLPDDGKTSDKKESADEKKTSDKKESKESSGKDKN